MDERLFYCAGETAAVEYAVRYLKELGFVFTDVPSTAVTDLLLDVPSFGSSGQLRCGGAVEKVLESLSKDITVYGGNLPHPALSAYRTVDLLRDESYLAENAYITAECALDVALPYLSVTLRDCPVLILGWGRIGKCLGQLLKAIGADVTIAARKAADRAMIATLGYHAEDTAKVADGLGYFRLIFNTVPVLLLNQEAMSACKPDCVKIDLASKPGMEDNEVITARGLPGIHMPESSGKLIAKTLLRLYQGGLT